MSELVEYQGPGKVELCRTLALLSILPHAPTVSKATILAWGTVLEDSGIRPDEWVEGARRLMQSVKAWPAPAQLIEACRIIRAERAPNVPQLPVSQGRPITPEERDAIRAQMRHPELILELFEDGRRSKRYRAIPDEDVVINDEDIARRDEQVRRMRGES